MDDLLPQDGSFYQPDEPEEQKTERKKAESKSLAAVPKLKEIVKDLEEDITHFKSVESIEIDPMVNSETFIRAWLIRQELFKYAVKKKEFYESMIPENLR